MTSGTNLFHEGEYVSVVLFLKEPQRIPAMTYRFSISAGPAETNISLGLSFGFNYSLPELHFQFAFFKKR